MLLSLRSTIQSNMISLMQQFNQDVSSLGNRVEHMEARMRDHATTINSLTDAHKAQSEEQAWIKDKLANIEDRSCRDNVNIRGISEEVQDLSAYVRGLIRTLIPELKNIELIIDHIHRLPKPGHLNRLNTQRCHPTHPLLSC